jgi:hypothetical protein
MLLRYVGLGLLSAPVCAADFRALDIGDACASVQAKEEIRGSVAIPWKQLSGADTYAFRGRDFDRDLTITYFCPKGALFSGNYYFPVEQFDAVVNSYHKAYDLMISRYGTPFVDNSPWQLGAQERDPRWIASDPRKYMTSWKTTRVFATMSLMQSFESEGPGWRVFVVVSRLKK